LSNSLAGGTLQDIDDKYTAKFKGDNIKVTGFFKPTEITPNGIMKLQIAMDEDYNKGEFSSGFATVYVTPTVPPDDEFHNLYTELIKNLDVGPEWIEALRGQQNITTNFNLKEKFGLENDIITEYAPGTKDNYTVKINEDPVSIAEALDLFKSSKTGNYEVPVMSALSAQLLNGLANSGTAEEDLNVINDALKTKGIQGLQSLDKKLQEKVNKALNNTPYIFDNKGVIYDNLHRLDELGIEEQDASPAVSGVLPSNNLKGYKTQAKKEAEALGAVEITSNDFDNVTISNSAYAPYAQPVVKKFLQLVDDAGIAAEIDGLYRTDAYNKALPNSAANSLHKEGLGIDIDVKKGSQKYKDIIALIKKANKQTQYTGDETALSSYRINYDHHGNPPHLHLEFDWAV